MTLRRSIGIPCGGDHRTSEPAAGNRGLHDQLCSVAEAEAETEADVLDMLIVGAGFSGIWLLHGLRQLGFKAKIIEAGSDLGGVWFWNRYPGARVDSQYPLYALSLPQVYQSWTWKSHYPDHSELRDYFQHIEQQLNIKKDCVFDSEVHAATWNDDECIWTIESKSGRKFRAKFFAACTGFATKRAFPKWQGLDTFEGDIYHSSFWPEETVNVHGKRVAVVGTGSTGVQITQEWAQQIGEDGHLKMFQRTPNFACRMNQIFMTGEEQAEHNLAERMAARDTFYGGFLWQSDTALTTGSTPAERNEFYRKLWNMGGFRFLMSNYGDMMRGPVANREAYDFWRERVRERVKDARKQELLAPKEPPHAFGGKRVSLEQDFYDQFNRPNVDVIDVRDNPICRVDKNGIYQQDGTFHQLDAIALATGFDAITGGLKDIKIQGKDGELLTDKWKKGTLTYLGLSTARFPNFFFTYGPQAPTAFSNGPTCIEIQGNWIINVLKDMRDKGWRKIDAQEEAEITWKKAVDEAIHGSLRANVDSWYNGANIPGKMREHLNYAGGIPNYKRILTAVRDMGMEGFYVE